MTVLGYFISSEEHRPQALVEQAVRAEQAGFDALWVSDHYHPWNSAQGQSPFVWSVLGAIATSTSTVRCTTAVTAPTLRIHPAVVAQAAATTAAMFEGRFSFGVGTGEALNEHIFGDAWPTLDVRLEMLEEAVDVMRRLWTGELVRHRGTHYTVDTARLYTLPDAPPPVLVSGFGPKATELAARIGDGYVNTSPDAEMLQLYRSSGGTGPAHGGLKVCWAEDEAEARRTMHRLWFNESLPGEASQVLPSPAHFEQLAPLVTEEMACEGKPVGPRVEDYVAAVQEYVDAGYDEVYLSQVGPDQAGFFDFFERELRPALQDLRAG
ncbi:MAG: Similar to F420-dependent glucose-6-phosphate dehydrogenase, SCO6495 family [uncultured Frankineae bacterium]|uniref:Similar to F420-dependent glucose-6-phosphate dehydrogenase, SCO6495 family n=1 Tax=uncultured Frankineae bacterium TaxID=437475 RepID=A0A6J4LSZ8_9ACTN|nr:MAG: Similar to F420-dependent glucose-6-phosphate dehydrogenase, SCO6495 family [uncultured Frankineae bacterium]